MANNVMRADKAVALLSGISRTDVRKAMRRGEVLINGDVITRPELKTDLEGAIISVGGVEFCWRDKVYIMMNKPAGCVCTAADEPESVINLLPQELFRRDLFTVGRLDKDTTGLLLITNDGDFAHRVTSPKKHVVKRYEALLSEPLSEQGELALLCGVTLADGEFCKALNLEFFDRERKSAVISVDSGKYHQVKRMFAAVGSSVVSLNRLSVGGLTLGSSLPLGGARLLEKSEAERAIVHNT